MGEERRKRKETGRVRNEEGWTMQERVLNVGRRKRQVVSNAMDREGKSRERQHAKKNSKRKVKNERWLFVGKFLLVTNREQGERVL